MGCRPTTGDGATSREVARVAPPAGPRRIPRRLRVCSLLPEVVGKKPLPAFSRASIDLTNRKSQPGFEKTLEAPASNSVFLVNSNSQHPSPPACRLRQAAGLSRAPLSLTRPKSTAHGPDCSWTVPLRYPLQLVITVGPTEDHGLKTHAHERKQRLFSSKAAREQ